MDYFIYLFSFLILIRILVGVLRRTSTRNSIEESFCSTSNQHKHLICRISFFKNCNETFLTNLLHGLLVMNLTKGRAKRGGKEKERESGREMKNRERVKFRYVSSRQCRCRPTLISDLEGTTNHMGIASVSYSITLLVNQLSDLRALRRISVKF